jgi:hypothetical protein
LEDNDAVGFEFAFEIDGLGEGEEVKHRQLRLNGSLRLSQHCVHQYETPPEQIVFYSE